MMFHVFTQIYVAHEIINKEVILADHRKIKEVLYNEKDLLSIRRDSVSRILAIARELHISLDAIAYAGTSRPNSVSADVLEFFSGKDDAESKDYFYLPYVGKIM